MKKFILKCNVRKYNIYLYIPKILEPGESFSFYVYIYDGKLYHRLKFKKYECIEDIKWEKHEEWMMDFIQSYEDYNVSIFENIDELKDYIGKGKVAMKLSL